MKIVEALEGFVIIVLSILVFILQSNVSILQNGYVILKDNHNLLAAGLNSESERLNKVLGSILPKSGYQFLYVPVNKTVTTTLVPNKNGEEYYFLRLVDKPKSDTEVK